MAETVVSAFMAGWASRVGCPSVATTDRGRQFQSALFTALANILGARHIHTIAYHPSANGLVERLHRQLKAALTNYEPRQRWSGDLPFVFLGIQSALMADLDSSSAELVYRVPLRLPGEFLYPFSLPLIHTASIYIRDLRNTFRHITPVTPASCHPQSVFVSQDLASCTHAFIRLDHIRPTLTATYGGPFRVLHRGQETFPLDVKCREDMAAVRLKFVAPTATGYGPL
ncbi:uncharacterized protein LOC144119915 [Amblyomma americanum]